MQQRVEAIAPDQVARKLKARELLCDEDLQSLWRVKSGALRIDTVLEDGSCQFVRLALPGDILGIEHFAGSDEILQISALTQTRLVLMSDLAANDITPILMESLRKSHQRCREMVSLRTGPVDERVKRLLCMLSVENKRDQSAARCRLPSLGNMAEIVHSTRETVCRVLSNLRDMQLLESTSVNPSKRRRLDTREHRLHVAAMA